MTTKVDHTHSVVLKMQSHWLKGTATAKVWSWRFALSGADLTTSAAAQSCVNELWTQMKGYVSNTTYLVEAYYYVSGAKVATYVFDYPANGNGANEGGGWSFWNVSGGAQQQTLQVAAMIRAPIGRNTKGREYYLRKFLHDVPGVYTSNEGIIVPQLTAAGTAALTALGSGFGDNNWVVVDPTTGNAPTAPWQLVPSFTSHKLNRGGKTKH